LIYQCWCTKKNSDLSWVISPYRNKFKRIIEVFRPHLDLLFLKIYGIKIKSQWSLNFLPNTELTIAIQEFKPDILHLHWVGGGFTPLSYEIFKNNYPVIISLYDMWAFTGGCHYSSSCTRF